MGEHTPGPWAVDGAGPTAMVRGADLSIVAVRHRLPSATHEANARLIAAAPDLLEAARIVLAGLHARIDAAPPTSVPVFDGIADRAAAIARATEPQPTGEGGGNG